MKSIWTADSTFFNGYLLVENTKVQVWGLRSDVRLLNVMVAALQAKALSDKELNLLSNCRNNNANEKILSEGQQIHHHHFDG